MLNAEELDKVKLDSSEEMEFHYFKLHDYDNNNKLDGLELAAAMTHYHESGPDENHKVSESWLPGILLFDYHSSITSKRRPVSLS